MWKDEGMWWCLVLSFMKRKGCGVVLITGIREGMLILKCDVELVNDLVELSLVGCGFKVGGLYFWRGCFGKGMVVERNNAGWIKGDFCWNMGFDVVSRGDDISRVIEVGCKKENEVMGWRWVDWEGGGWQKGCL